MCTLGIMALRSSDRSTTCLPAAPCICSTVVGVAPPSWTKGLTDTIYAFNTSSRAPVYYSWWTQYSLGASNRWEPPPTTPSKPTLGAAD